MEFTFSYSKFKGDISKWDVSNVKDMRYMFYKSNFNGDISKWDVRKVEEMDNMFSGSKFNRDISKWDVRNVVSFITLAFEDSPLEDKEEFWPKKTKK